jgi:hypothetical protein
MRVPRKVKAPKIVHELVSDGSASEESADTEAGRPDERFTYEGRMLLSISLRGQS